MSTADTKANRPLSPHIQIYRWHLTMVMSIVHRVTGAALYFGTALLAWWLIAAASGPAYFDFVNGLFGSWPGLVVVFGYSWALIHHMLGGIRYLIWDTGRGLGQSGTRQPRPRHHRRLDRPHRHSLDRHRPGGAMRGSMRTPLGRVLGFGSAHEGTGHFWRQRLTALANVPLLIALALILVAGAGRPYAEVVALLASPLSLSFCSSPCFPSPSICGSACR